MFFSSIELKIALAYLKIKEFRGLIAIFAFLGIAIGIAALVVTTSVMNGFRDELISHVTKADGHINIINTDLSREELKDRLSHINDIEGIKGIALQLQFQSMASFGGKVFGVIVKGVCQKDIIAEDLITNAIKQGDINLTENGIIIGQKIAERFDIKVGDKLRLISGDGFFSIGGFLPRIKTLEVVGVFDSGVEEYDTFFVYVPFDIASKLFGTEQKPNVINVYIKNIDDTQRIKSQIQKILDLKVTDWQQKQGPYQSALKIEKNVMSVILMMIVLVAVFNIISSLYMLAEEKRSSIAILRTIGMEKSSVVKIFLLCGLIIGFSGTVFGCVLGVVICFNINSIKSFLELALGQKIFDAKVYFFEKIPVALDITEVGFICLACVILSLLSAVPAACRALACDPAEVLR